MKDSTIFKYVDKKIQNSKIQYDQAIESLKKKPQSKLFTDPNFQPIKESLFRRTGNLPKEITEIWIYYEWKRPQDLFRNPTVISNSSRNSTKDIVLGKHIGFLLIIQ